MLLPPGVSEEDINDWQARVSVTDINSFSQVLLKWQRSQGRVTDRRYVLVRTTYNSSPLLVLIDEARSHWIGVQKYVAESSSLEAGPIIESLAQLESEDGILLFDSSLPSSIKNEFPKLNVVEFARHHDSKTVARIGAVSNDLAHLRFSDSIQLSFPLDMALSQAAQHVLRNFAYRLPGFADSNLPYLFRNFLDFPATVDEEASRLVVRIGQPPLRLVLGITGMTRQTYRLSWLGDRPLTLFEES
jgi:hypothetical protein